MNRPRVLIADAHRNMLEAVQALLSDLVGAVTAVTDEQSLLDAAVALAPDLIIVDLSLPVMGPGNVICRLRAACPAAGAKVIALSIHDEPEVARSALACGAAGFVLKRAAATDLRPAVREVLEDRAYISPAAQEAAALAACH